MKQLYIYFCCFLFVLTGTISMGFASNPDFLAPEEIRSFDDDKVRSFQNDPDFQYGKRPDLSGKKTAGDARKPVNLTLAGIWKILMYAIAILAILVVAYLVIQTTMAPSSKKIGQSHPQSDLDGDIRELDFDQLIKQALGQESYRQAVRLLYLETLKQLTNHAWIDWQQYKTNQDYRHEMNGTPLQKHFDDLSRSFEYVWYGNFPVNRESYSMIEQVFHRFRKLVTQKP